MTTQTITRTAKPTTAPTKIAGQAPTKTADNGSPTAAVVGHLVFLARRFGAWVAGCIRTHSWLRTLFAATAALAVCVAAVVYTPIEAPTSWRSAGQTVSTVRHPPAK